MTFKELQENCKIMIRAYKKCVFYLSQILIDSICRYYLYVSSDNSINLNFFHIKVQIKLAMNILFT